MDWTESNRKYLEQLSAKLNQLESATENIDNRYLSFNKLQRDYIHSRSKDPPAGKLTEKNPNTLQQAVKTEITQAFEKLTRLRDSELAPHEDYIEAKIKELEAKIAAKRGSLAKPKVLQRKRSTQRKQPEGRRVTSLRPSRDKRSASRPRKPRF